ncbi:hypothetical protein RI054_35g134850 [Pseudoscourfieldia marina]
MANTSSTLPSFSSPSLSRHGALVCSLIVAVWVNLQAPFAVAANDHLAAGGNNEALAAATYRFTAERAFQLQLQAILTSSKQLVENLPEIKKASQRASKADDDSRRSLETTYNNSNACQWDSENNQCEFDSKSSIFNTWKPTSEDGERVKAIFELEKTCASLNTEGACKATNGCLFDSTSPADTNKCTLDGFRAYDMLGFSERPQTCERKTPNTIGLWTTKAVISCQAKSDSKQCVETLDPDDPDGGKMCTWDDVEGACGADVTTKMMGTMVTEEDDVSGMLNLALTSAECSRKYKELNTYNTTMCAEIDSRCAYDAEREECGIAANAVGNALLGNSTQLIAIELIGMTLTCMSKNDTGTCMASSACQVKDGACSVSTIPILDAMFKNLDLTNSWNSVIKDSALCSAYGAESKTKMCSSIVGCTIQGPTNCTFSMNSRMNDLMNAAIPGASFCPSKLETLITGVTNCMTQSGTCSGEYCEVQKDGTCGSPPNAIFQMMLKGEDLDTILSVTTKCSSQGTDPTTCEATQYAFTKGIPPEASQTTKAAAAPKTTTTDAPILLSGVNVVSIIGTVIYSLAIIYATL